MFKTITIQNRPILKSTLSHCRKDLHEEVRKHMITAVDYIYILGDCTSLIANDSRL